MAIGRSFGEVWAVLISVLGVLSTALGSLAAEPPASVIKPVTATASSSYNADMGPEKTIDGSGLDPNDGHSTLETTMWLSAASTPLPAWIQYEFDAPHRLKEMWVWNSNQTMESLFGFGAESVMVDYSTDAVKWATLSDVQFARAPGKAAYVHNTIVDFAGVMAKYVRLTIHSTWGSLLSQGGLSEVRFFRSPVTVVVDDFESYTNDSPHRLYETWIDGIGYAGQAGNGSGAAAGHDISARGTPYTTIVETTIVQSGRQAMPLSYNNTKPPFYSQVERTFAAPEDWTAGDPNVLSLWFRGKSSNAPGLLYMALEDAAGKNTGAVHENLQAVLLEEWQQWQIDLKVFCDGDVNLQDVKKLSLGVGDRLNPEPAGTGILCIDDIEVQRATSNLDHPPAVSRQGSIIEWGIQRIDSSLSHDHYTAVAAGIFHSLALKRDGSIVGWGNNEYGRATPPAGQDFTAIGVGTFHSLALKKDGSIVGWGDNGSRQATPPAGQDFTAIAAGKVHSLALKKDGSIVGWGYNMDIVGNWIGQATPPTGKDFIAIAACIDYSLALRKDGSIVGWGDDGSVQATPPMGNDFTAIATGGFHSLALKRDGSIVGWGANTWGQATPPTGNDFTAIAAGTFHSLALKKDGSIVGWGNNSYGQATPPAGNDFKAIAAGEFRSLALKKDGPIVSWGYDEYGKTTPPDAKDFTAIAAGEEHSLALRKDGLLVSWGDDEFGQATPPAGNDFVAGAAGIDHGLALKEDGSIVGWGSNYRWSSPSQKDVWAGQASPPAGNDFTAIAAGGYHSLALKKDGSIVGWGANEDGQATPPAGNNFTAIAAGIYHSLALKKDGSIVGWGANWDGQATPPAGNDFTAIAAGGYHSLALKKDGSIVGWGANWHGQANPPPGNDFVAIAAGEDFSLAIRREEPVPAP